MIKQDIDNLPNHAGIYLLRNKVNGKCYVGQAIKLKRRLRDHWKNYHNDRYSHIVLYRALKKYGIENFELSILKVFRNALDWKVHLELDKLEKEYIQKFDSYANGYNSTLGGDGGVLGLKHSEESIHKIQEGLKAKYKREKEANPECWIKAKNLETEEILVFHSIREAEIELDIRYVVIHNCLCKRQKIAYKKWQFVYFNDEFESLPKWGSEELQEILFTQLKRLSNKDSILAYIKENPTCTYGEVSQTFELSKKTFFNYKNELGIKFNQRVDTKVDKKEFTEYFSSHSKSECISHFNITERRYYKYIAKYING